jgi:hypothetical protein
MNIGGGIGHVQIGLDVIGPAASGIGPVIIGTVASVIGNMHCQQVRETRSNPVEVSHFA